MTRQTVGEALRTHRQLAGLSVREAAAHAGVSQSRWRQAEAGYESRQGRKIPVQVTPNRLVRMARAIGLDPIVLLEIAGHDTGHAEAALEDRIASPSGAMPVVNVDGLDAEAIARVQAYADGMKQLMREQNPGA